VRGFRIDGIGRSAATVTFSEFSTEAGPRAKPGAAEGSCPAGGGAKCRLETVKNILTPRCDGVFRVGSESREVGSKLRARWGMVACLIP
jgi:hypothetical protein